MRHLMAHWLGLDNSSGPIYAWWSGPGSDLGELAIVAVVYHHLNCHEPGCWRIARHACGGRCRRHMKTTMLI